MLLTGQDLLELGLKASVKSNQRSQDKCPLAPAGMGQLQPRALKLQPAPPEQIQIQRPRPPALLSHPIELQFQDLQPPQQLQCRRRGGLRWLIHNQHRIDVVRLVRRTADRSRTKER